MVSAILTNLDRHRSLGHEATLVIVLKKCSLEHAPVLSYLYNKYLAVSRFTFYWKSSAVDTVFKNSGELSGPSNHHTISFLSVFVRRLLSDKTYGFRFPRLTADVLTIIAGRFYQHLDKTGEVEAVFLDKPEGI